MNHDTFSIAYTAIHPGTEKTDILFYEPETAESFAGIFSPGAGNSPRIFVTDAVVANLPLMKTFIAAFTGSQPETNDCLVCGTDILVVLGAGESFKTIENVLKIVQIALDNNLQRSSTFIGIGGGVICDITAFAASTFKRGARLELVPTTLLAMVDASVGGKTGCDFGTFKNMIGTFYPAAKIHFFTGFIQSLPESEYRSGLAETVKTGLLYAPKLFDIIQHNKDAVLSREPETIRQMIRRCVIAKANIVEKDLAEQGPRMQLNFGHTFGHALESCCGLGSIPHGDAVAWGMSRALDLSRRLKLCSTEYYQEVCEVLTSYGWEISPEHSILVASGLDPEAAATKIISAMKKDKKNTSPQIRCILQREINSTVIQEVPEQDIRNVLLPE